MCLPVSKETTGGSLLFFFFFFKLNLFGLDDFFFPPFSLCSVLRQRMEHFNETPVVFISL